ncbi:hypothetical protein BGZ76_005190, partial [Entomortierella beljakovae]
MGVGKSYLALFLVAKAYSEGWKVLYVSDAIRLPQETSVKSSWEICKRFFGMNKNDLTTLDLDALWTSSENVDEAINIVASTILDTLLSKRNEKTLFVIDEHGKLFNGTTPKPHLAARLIDIHAWNPARNGARVVYTGTAHAGYETIILTGDIDSMLGLVGPLSDFVFDKLLGLNPILNGFKKETKLATNNVPRELNKLVEHLQECGNKIEDKKAFFYSFEFKRRLYFKVKAEEYFNRLDPSQKKAQLSALSKMFEPDRSGFLNESQVPYQYEFKDKGLVYRVKVGPETKYDFLCPSAKGGLLDVYRDVPLPLDLVNALLNNNITGEQYEEAVFRNLIRHKELTFDTTNIAGEKKTPLEIDVQYFEMATDPPSKICSNNTLRRFSSQNHKGFDFVYNKTFIQVSKSAFDVHDVKYAKISKAFARENEEAPSNSEDSDNNEALSNGGSSGSKVVTSKGKTSGTQHGKRKITGGDSTSGLKKVERRNQIEMYLDAAFEGKHEANMNPVTNCFEVFQVNERGEKQKIDDFRIVYICDVPGTPNHSRIVKNYPDLLYVNGDEVDRKIFGDLREGRLRGRRTSRN